MPNPLRHRPPRRLPTRPAPPTLPARLASLQAGWLVAWLGALACTTVLAAGPAAAPAAPNAPAAPTALTAPTPHPAPPAPAAPVTPEARAAAETLARVHRLIGDAACRSQADCQTIGVGHRACGGPARYLAWSSWRTSGHALEQAAARTRVPLPASPDTPNMSTCQVLADPGAQCLPMGATPVAADTPGRCSLRKATLGIR